MGNRFRYLFKNIGLLTLSNFASKIMVFLLVPLYTSVLSTTEYGTYDLVISTISLMYPILTLNIVDSVMRFSMDKRYSQKTIASIGMQFIMISVLMFALFLFLLRKAGLVGSIHNLEGYIFAYYLFYILNHFFIQFSKGLERVVDMGIAGVLGTIIMLGANILFLLVFRWGLVGFFFANILSLAMQDVYYIMRLKFFKYIEWPGLYNPIRKEMLIYCVPLVVSTLGWWVNSASDKYMVTLFCGVAANGILAVAYKIPSIINTLQGIFVQAWQISAIKEYGQKDVAKFYGRSFCILNICMSITCAILIILSKPLAHLLYARDFYQAWQYVPFLLISSVLNSASGFLGPILSARKDSKAMAKSAVYGALVNIFLNIVLIYCIGVQGATIATVVASFVIFYVRNRAARNDIVIEKYWRIWVTWIILCIQALFEIYFTAGLVQIILVLIMLFINQNILKELFDMFVSDLIKDK